MKQNIVQNRRVWYEMNKRENKIQGVKVRIENAQLCGMLRVRRCINESLILDKHGQQTI